MNIIITGASKGIGFEIVKLFLEDKENKVVALSRNTDSLSQLKATHSNGDNLQAFSFDIANYDKEKLEAHTSHFNSIDILINNAGKLINNPFESTTLSEWRAVFDVNLFAPVQMINDLLPKLNESSAAHIVNIGSMGGLQGSMKFPGLSAYSASKAALANLTECLAEELKETSISVNCLCLGAVNTEMLRTAFPDYAAPLESTEMASYIHHFATTNHKFMNGKILPISSSTP